MIQRKIRFVRYVDDYRIFATSFAEAHSHLHFLIERLDTEGLFLNTSKTVFMDIERGGSDYDAAEEKALSKFEAIDEQEKLVTQKSVRVGYVARIVKSYRFPGQEKIKKLETEDLEKAAGAAGDAPFERAEEKIRFFV